MSRPPRIYYYRGEIERGARYTWKPGYSADSIGDNPRPLYPWMTKRECQADARRDGYVAVFFRDGEKEGTR